MGLDPRARCALLAPQSSVGRLWPSGSSLRDPVGGHPGGKRAADSAGCWFQRAGTPRRGPPGSLLRLTWKRVARPPIHPASRTSFRSAHPPPSQSRSRCPPPSLLASLHHQPCSEQDCLSKHSPGCAASRLENRGAPLSLVMAHSHRLDQLRPPSLHMPFGPGPPQSPFLGCAPGRAGSLALVLLGTPS